MASHHHCHHQQTHHNSTCYSCTCTCTCSSPHQPSYHPPSQLSPTDPLLQAIASQLLLQHQPQTQHQHHFSHHFNEPHHPQNQNHQHHKPQPHHNHPEQEQLQTQASFTSLLRRVDALESSFQHFSPSPSSKSLKHIAARTIQTRFRAYLVKRSRTLRQLKELATIKSTSNALISSISHKPHFNPEALSKKAMDLLLKLDSIQSDDPMIRDGKRSISKELVKFLDYIDGVLVKRQQLCSKPKKVVRFARDVRESRVYEAVHEPFSGEEVRDSDDQEASSDDERKAVEKLCDKIENIEGISRVYEEETETESEASSCKLSDGGKDPRSNSKITNDSASVEHFRGRGCDSLFSAPLPVQMEPIRDDLKKRERRL